MMRFGFRWHQNEPFSSKRAVELVTMAFWALPTIPIAAYSRPSLVLLN
jgi:hypothetical protein